MLKKGRSFLSWPSLIALAASVLVGCGGYSEYFTPADNPDMFVRLTTPYATKADVLKRFQEVSAEQGGALVANDGGIHVPASHKYCSWADVQGTNINRYETLITDEYHFRVNCKDMIFGPMAKIKIDDRKYIDEYDMLIKKIMEFHKAEMDSKKDYFWKP